MLGPDSIFPHIFVTFWDWKFFSANIKTRILDLKIYSCNVCATIQAFLLDKNLLQLAIHNLRLITSLFVFWHNDPISFELLPSDSVLAYNDLLSIESCPNLIKQVLGRPGQPWIQGRIWDGGGCELTKIFIKRYFNRLFNCLRVILINKMSIWICWIIFWLEPAKNIY